MDNKKTKIGQSIWKAPLQLFFVYYFFSSYVAGYTTQKSLLNALLLSGVLLFFYFIGQTFFSDKEYFIYWNRKNKNNKA